MECEIKVDGEGGILNVLVYEEVGVSIRHSNHPREDT